MKWQFDAAVASTFERELEQSIPGLASLRWWNDALARKLLGPGDLCVDIGCSVGSCFDKLAEEESIDFWGIDTSAPMIDRARLRFAGRSNVTFVCGDASEMEFPRRACLTMCVLSLQFVGPERRARILKLIGAHSDHALIVEKVGDLDHLEMVTDTYYDFKRVMGVNEERIVRKREMLEDVLIPLSRAENEQMLAEAGFAKVTQYWANGPFVGWVASTR